jgi:hypothetical protein
VAEVFRTRPGSGSPPEAIVIHCSDPRFRRHFQEFLESHLKVSSYGLVAVPGGPQFLTLTEYLPKFSWVGWRWVKFLFDVARPRRVILIAHHDCLWYRDGRFWQGRLSLYERQIRDLRAVRQALLERFSGVTVELYFALLDGEQAAFESI